MVLGIKIIRKAGLTISKSVTFIFIFIYLLQTAGLVYLLYERGEKVRLIEEQEQKIKDLESRVKILKIIEDFKVGLSKEEAVKLSGVLYSESKKYGYDPLLIVALIVTESSFKKDEESMLGAQGLMQVKPSVGQELAKKSGLEWKDSLALFDPAFNIQLGTLHLFHLILEFKDVKKALIAYNVGEDALRTKIKSGDKLPTYFLAKVLKKYKELKAKYG